MVLRTLFVLSFGIAMILGPPRATWGGESWIFRPSYYSHDPIRAVQVGPPARSPDRGPYYTRSLGAYVQSGYHRTQGFITVRGRSFDHVNVWESWFKTGTQY